MKKKTFTHIFHLIAIIGVITLAACGGSSGGGGGTGDGTGDSAVLVTTDFPTSGICATGSQDVTVQALLDMLANATQVELQIKPYGSDADIPFMCGLNAVWDPDDPNAFAKSVILSTTQPVSDVLGLTIGPVYMCNTGFGFTPGSAATAGLHEAETYRGELVLTDALANTVRIRIRFTVSGTDAGKTLASLGLSGADLSLTDANGNPLPTVGDVLALFAANPASVTANLVSGVGTVHITALGRVICWEQQ